MKLTKKQLRQAVSDKTNGKCSYCGCDLPDRWHIDHVHPIERDSRYDYYKKRFVSSVHESRKYLDCIENMLPACPKCNINKHSDDIDTFRKHIYGYVNSMNLRMVQYQMAKKYGLIQETGKEIQFYFEKIGIKIPELHELINAETK